MTCGVSPLCSHTNSKRDSHHHPIASTTSTNTNTMKLTSSWPFVVPATYQEPVATTACACACATCPQDDPLSKETQSAQDSASSSSSPPSSCEGVPSVSRKRTRLTIHATTTTRHVHFAVQEAQLIPTSSSYNNNGYDDVHPNELWYSTTDYANFRYATMAVANHYAARQWLRELVQAYRALKEATQAQQVYEVLRPSSNNSSTNGHNDCHALYLGLEQWVLSQSLEKTQRRGDILRSIEYWQAHKEILPAVSRRQQIRKTSLARSRPAGMLAVYIARRVATSVRQEQGNAL